MDPIYDSCRVNSVLSDVVVFPSKRNATGQPTQYNTLNGYIHNEYEERCLFLRDMIIARDTRPEPIVEQNSNDSGSVILSIRFPDEVHVYYDSVSETLGNLYERIKLDNNLINDPNTISYLSNTHWDIEITSENPTTLTIPENTFYNKYGNGNEEINYNITT